MPRDDSLELEKVAAAIEHEASPFEQFDAEEGAMPYFEGPAAPVFRLMRLTTKLAKEIAAAEAVERNTLQKKAA